MVRSTRAGTNSLPAKKPTLADEQAAASQQGTKHKSSAPKVKSKAAPAAAEPDLHESEPASSDSEPEQIPEPQQSKVRKHVTTDANTTSAPAKEKRAKAKSNAQQAYRSQSQSPFFALPPELRNHIYSYVLVETMCTIQINHARPFVREPGLLCVSRQVRDEAMTIFYGENTFVTSGSVMIVKFLRTSDEEVLRAIQQIRLVTTEMRTPKDAITRLEMMMREFKSRGLRKTALHFQVNDEGERAWRNLPQLLEF